MINLNDPLAVMATWMPWSQLEAAIVAKFEHRHCAGQILQAQDMFGTSQTVVGSGRRDADRPRLAIRLMASLLYLKHSFNLCDEELVVCWSENIVWQFFSGMAYYAHRLPCDAVQIGRFRRDLGEDGLELLLKATIDTAVAIHIPWLGYRHSARAGAAVNYGVMNSLVAHPRLTAVRDGLKGSQIIVCLLNAGLLDAQRQVKARALCAATLGAHPAPLLHVLMCTGIVAARATFEALSDHYSLPLLQRAEELRNTAHMPTACAQLALSLSWGDDQAWLLWPNPEFAKLADAADSLLDALEPVTAFCIVLARPLRAQARTAAKQLLAQGCAEQLNLALPADLQAMQEQVRQTPAPCSADLMASSASGLDMAHLCELAEVGPVVELVSAMLSRAVATHTSDVHLEPKERGFHVCLRVDGAALLLEQYAQLPYEAVVCRIKILAELDIAERRLPEDGRLQARVNGLVFDVRVSEIPSALGESVVLRQDRVPQQLADLGLSEPQDAQLHSWLKPSYGMVLVTGPTGSDRSTTLYTAVNLLDQSTDKIVMLEDLVEYQPPSTTQMQVSAEIGLCFAETLQSILRHDSDVILVSEIRDAETEKMATQAPLNRNLVLTTLHTNTVAGAVTRRLDMDVEPFLLGDSLRGIIAQRVVGRLCTASPRPHTSAEQALTPGWVRLGLERTSLTDAERRYRPVGREQCQKTVYRDRLAL